jgi:hypothetical protein
LAKLQRDDSPDPDSDPENGQIRICQDDRACVLLANNLHPHDDVK